MKSRTHSEHERAAILRRQTAAATVLGTDASRYSHRGTPEMGIQVTLGGGERPAVLDNALMARWTVGCIWKTPSSERQ